MRVRVVALALALAWGLLSGPLAAEGQPAGAAGRVPRIGLISNANPTTGATFVNAFRGGLAASAGSSDRTSISSTGGQRAIWGAIPD